MAFPPDMNERQFCYYLCSSYNCPLICVPFPPEFTFPPPPPPPHQSSHHIVRIIVVVAVLASTFFLVSVCSLLIKISSRRSRALSNNTHDQTHNPMNHIRYIGTVGLQESVINSITVCKFRRGEGLIEGTECSICLNEFHDDENLRLLPSCRHAFHLPCIDTWLKSHQNCPLCRTNVVSNPVSSPSIDPNSPSDSVGESQVGNSQSHLGLGSNGGNGVVGNHSSELGDLPSPHVNYGFRSQSDLTDYNRSRKGAIEVMNDHIQPIRRSISMDSSVAWMVSISLANLLPLESEGSSTDVEIQDTGDKKSSSGESLGLKRNVCNPVWNQNMSKILGNCSEGPFAQKRPALMKRSFSGGGKFFLTRYGRSQEPILPM